MTAVAAAFRSTWARFAAHSEPPVFLGSAALVVAFVVAGAAFTEPAAELFRSLQEGASRRFGWWYLSLVFALLLTAAALVLSPARRVRLGGPDARPEFGRLGWFGMLFAAGMGIGLVYFGVAEPMLHYDSPLDAEPGTPAALRESMRISYFHWGLSAWAVYVVLALSIAHAHFNRGLPLAPRSALEPLLGERIYGPAGHAVDILCTVGTLLGVATSLGLGAMQIAESLERFFGLPAEQPARIGIIVGITAIATASVVIGVKGGVRRLSQLNVGLAGLLLLFVIVAGPTLWIVEIFVSTLGGYLATLPRMSLRLDLGPDSPWQTTWTLFYWGWWISWSPFVAIFVARISRGRTVREFILGVMLAPTLATFLWLSAFGGTGLWFAERAPEAGLMEAVRQNSTASLQALLEALPLSSVTLVLATLVIALFFVTSSDSGSLVDDMVTSGGDPNPPTATRVFWAVSEGAAAVTLLLLGGLEAIRNAAISLGLPMSLLLAAAAVCVWRSLHADPMARGPRRRA